MALNLLTYLQEQFTPTVIDQLSARLNESPAGVRKAVDGAIPAVLGGLTQRASNEGDAGAIIDLLRNGNYGKTTTPLDVGQVTDTSAETQAAVGAGSNFIQRIFGNHTDDVSAELARFSGVATPAATAIVDLVGAVLMGVLGRQALDNGLTATNLSTLLTGQADYYRTALPAGLGNVAAQLGLDKLRGSTKDMAAQPVDSYTSTPINPNIPKSPEIDRRKENIRWVRWAMAAVAALVVFLIVQKCRQPQSGTEGVYTDTTARVESDAVEDRSAATEQNVAASNASTQDTAAGPFDRTDGEPDGNVAIDLPGGRRLNLRERSFNANLATFLAGKDRAVPRTFTFENLTFETNSARITTESRQNVTDLIEIMKAYPTLNVRVEGHTDNTGDAATNRQLSIDRANAVKAALTAAGIEAGRITTQGFGADKPTASNDTPAGRQQNRRIDVVVTKL